MPLANPKFGPRHPQNVPLSKWTDGWLKLSIGAHIGHKYIMAHDSEKRAWGWPASRADMIAFLVVTGDVPAAGV